MAQLDVRLVFCSVVGLKPTYGRVSRFGLVSYANSLEQIGPIGKNVSDVVMVMNAIAAAIEKDHTTGPLGRAKVLFKIRTKSSGWANKKSNRRS